MNKITLLTLLISSSISVAYPQKNKFTIVGDVSGFKDSSFIRLYDFSTGFNVLMDSAQILHGSFVFKGAIDGDYQRLGLISFSDPKPDISLFWVQEGIIHFSAKKGDFDEAQITGSAMQQEESLLNTMVKGKSGAESKEIYISYIRNHPNSMLSGHYLQVYRTTWGKETIQLLYDQLSEKVKQSQFGQDVSLYLSLNRDIKTGDSFVDFTMTNIQGKNVSLSDYKNKYVLLDFWGSWCAPCRKENHNLVKVYAEFKNKGFEILGVAAESDKEHWAAAMKEDNIVWENVSDLKGTNSRAILIYGIKFYPSNLLIAPDGTIIAKDLRGEALKAKLSTLLQ